MSCEELSPSALPKAATGISGFDDVTFGGLPAGRPTLVCGGAGCGKTLFSTTFLVNGAVQFNEPGVFMSFEERAEDLVANVASLGYHLDDLVADKKLAIDHVRVERSEIEESGEYDLEGLFIRLGYAVDQIGAKRVVLDTIETLFAGLKDAAVLRSELRRLFGWLKDRGLTTVITGERGDGALTRQGLEEYVSDCVILLDNRVEEQITTRRLRIVKYRGSAHGTNEYPFLIDADGISVLPAATAIEALDLPERGDGEGRRVLVVEDNVDVGTFSTQLLQDLGYETTWAAGAEEALAILVDRSRDFDAVFSDVVMPGMNGLDLGREIHARYPDLPVILTSGYSDVLADDVRHGFELLKKPYAVEKLSEILRKVTGGAKRGGHIAIRD